MNQEKNKSHITTRNKQLVFIVYLFDQIIHELHFTD